MRLRTALSLANLVAIVVAFLVLFEFPAYASIAFYALVAWIFVGFGLMYLPGSRASPTGTDSSLASPFPGSGRPLPSGTGASPSPAIDFCVWCGTTLPAGAVACPACGRRVAPL